MSKKFKAITLVETLVYIAIFSIFMVILIQFFLSIQVNQDKVYKELELEMNQIFLTNHIQEILNGNSSFNFEEELFLVGGQSLEYVVLNEKLVLLKGGGNTNLLNGKAKINDFSFEPIWDMGGSALALRMNFSLEHSNDERVIRNFSTLVKLLEYED